MTITRTPPRTVSTVTRATVRGSRRMRVPMLVTVAAGAALLVGTNIWGRALQARGHRLFLNLPPLVGHLEVRFVLAAGAATIAVAVLAVVFAPRVARRLPWPRLLVGGFAAAVVWAVLLALTEGASGLTRSPASPSDYLASVPLMRDPARFLSTFVDRIDLFTTHVRAHPPAMALLAWTVDRLGGGPGAFGALEIVAGASSVPAVLIAVREIAGEDRARSAAPFLAFAPAAITLASSGDALFLGVSAWAVTTTIFATGDRRRWHEFGLAGGVLFGATAYLSYGLVLLAAIPILVAHRRGRLRALAFAAVGGLPVILAFSASGFWWVEGLLATRVEYLESAARGRPYPYFLVANVAAFAVVLGPATLAALARWTRSEPVWMLVGGALVAIAIADLSGMSKAEVERIWLPFVPWVIAATAMLPSSSRRTWLAVNVAFAVGLEIVLRQPW